LVAEVADRLLPASAIRQGGDDMDAPSWDEMYRSRDQVFSGNPNAVLVTEVSGLPPGRALDVGCGADALWLAGRGWQSPQWTSHPPL
jgi:hypothetical protein